MREAVALVARELMEVEVTAEIGAARGKGRAGGAIDLSQWVSPAGWETRVGEIDLLIPKKRQGPAYFPSLLEPRRGTEQAIVAVVLEAYVTASRPGRSTGWSSSRGIDGMTKDRVSAMCRALDEQVEAFRQRPLAGACPYLWLDAKHVKVLDHGRPRV